MRQYTPNFKPWPHTSPVQPNVIISEGTRPAQEFKPAAYLALSRFDRWYENWFVIQAGKVVALDSQGRVVPAGLAIQLALYKAAFENDTGNPTTVGARRANARAVAGLTKYTTNDVQHGVKNFAGLSVAADQPVVESFFSFNNTNLVALADNTSFGNSDVLTVVNPISRAIGIAPYNYYVWAGGDGSNPAQYDYHNYNLQHQVAVLCDAYIELPVVKDTNYASAPLTGIAAAIYSTGNPFRPGDFVKADINSNMVKADPASDSFFDVIGQVLAVDTDWPKDYLDRVRTAYTQLTTLDRTPGSATNGLPDNIFFAGGSAAEGVVRINLINR